MENGTGRMRKEIIWGVLGGLVVLVVYSVVMALINPIVSDHYSILPLPTLTSSPTAAQDTEKPAPTPQPTDTPNPTARSTNTQIPTSPGIVLDIPFSIDHVAVFNVGERSGMVAVDIETGEYEYLNIGAEPVYWLESNEILLWPPMVWDVEQGLVEIIFDDPEEGFSRGWSPNGDYIYWIEQEAIYLRFTQEDRIVTITLDGYVEDISISGDQLALRQELPYDSEQEAAFLSDMFIYQVENDSLQRLTEDAPGQLTARFSPDGSMLAVVSSWFNSLAGDGIPAGEILSIYSMDDLSLVVEFVGMLYRGTGENPNAGKINTKLESFGEIAWSEDGSRILFTEVRPSLHETDICILTLRTRKVDCPTQRVDGLSELVNVNPTWLSDNQILFLSGIGHVCISPAVIHVDGSGFRILNEDVCVRWRDPYVVNPGME